MSSLRRVLPAFWLGLIILVASFLSLPFTVDTISFRLLLFVFLAGIWLVVFGARFAAVDADSILVRKDILGNTDILRAKSSYFYMPIYHALEATLPNYLLKHEFDVDAIDTRTPGLQRIDKIRVRVRYRVVDAKTFYHKSAYGRERLKAIESERKLQRSDVGLWRQFLNELMRGTIDDAVRDGVWEWAEAVARNQSLQLDVPFPRRPEPENDPYALSLNRRKLADRILQRVDIAFVDWGLELEDLVFENVEIDAELIKRKTRDRERELAEAEHVARMEAAAMRIRGAAEAELRAETVRKVIEVLLNQKGLTLTNEVLYNVVRAAMYSDGQMIWSSVMEKGAAPAGTAKTA